MGVESNLAISIKVTNASDLAIPHLGIYPTNMLIYSNEIHKGLFMVYNSKRLETHVPISRELFHKWDTSTRRNAMEAKREVLC